MGINLQIGKELQLLIAAADDLAQQLEPLRARRARRSARVAAGVGAATSAVVGGAMWMANLGFWASLGTALGLATVPVVATVVGVGGLSLGMHRRRRRKSGATPGYDEQCGQVELTLACFQLMAEADGRISDEERLLLRSVTLQFPLEQADRERIEKTSPLATIQGAEALDGELRREVLRGTWMLAEADGVSPEEERLFSDLARRLGLEQEERQLKRESREHQAVVNDLVTAMFRSCQQVLSPSLGEAAANEFLESLAQIAATPRARRSLRNSLSSGFSAGGVARALEAHGQRAKLVAQAYNAVRAVYEEADQRKAAHRRLLDIVDSTSLDQGEVRGICADVDMLFDDSISAMSDVDDG